MWRAHVTHVTSDVQTSLHCSSKQFLKSTNQPQKNLVTIHFQVIFGTGDSERAVTVTANVGFVRAAAQAGVQYSVFLHEARALTEIKETRRRPDRLSENAEAL